MNLTKTDEQVLEYVQDRWFFPYELTFVAAHPEYRVKRLMNHGLLESRDVRFEGQTVTQYRRIKK